MGAAPHTRVFVEATGRVIAPFGDSPGEALLHNRPLRAWQREAFAEAGLEEVDSPAAPCLIVPDTLLTTGAVLRRFVEEAAGRRAVLVLQGSRFGEYNLQVQPNITRVEGGWRFDQVRFEGGGDEAVEVLIDPEEKVISIPVPRHYFGSETLELSLARAPVMLIEHWAHILWANQMVSALAARRRPRWRWVLWALWAALRAGSLNKWRVLGEMNRIGKGCDIHPTAVVEMSVLGDRVVIGPHARVRFSTLGDGCFIMGGAQVEHSVLGEGCAVSQDCALNFSVMYPGAVCSMALTQLTVFGRQVITTLAAYCIDMNFERNIRVPLDGALYDIGRRTLGCAIGHRAKLGTGVWVASGRMIPNDVFVMQDPSAVLHRLPEGLAGEGPLMNRGGTLVPVKEE